METKLEQTDMLLEVIASIPDSHREDSIKVIIDFAEFLKFKAEKQMFPFLLCRSAMEEWLSPEEEKAWEYLKVMKKE